MGSISRQKLRNVFSNQMEKQQQQQHRLFSLLCSAWVSINLEDPGVIIGARRDGTGQNRTGRNINGPDVYKLKLRR